MARGERSHVAWRACLLGMVITAGGVARAETLGDAIALAYQSNPTLQAQRASLRALDETYLQAEAGYRPTATMQAIVTTDTNNYTGTQRPLPGQSQPVIQGQSQTSGFAIGITQPLYNGGRVASEVTAADAAILAGRETLRGTEETTLRDVITAYADVRRDQQVVTILEDDQKLLILQQDEVHARFGVGEITRTDVAETESRVAASQAQLEAARAQLANSRAEYASVVGESPGSLAPEPPLASHLPPTLQTAFDWAEHNSPQIRQASFTEQSSAAKVAQAKAATRPTLALQGTAGYSGGTFANPGIPGLTPGVGGLGNPFRNFSYDVTGSLVLTVPVFTGGLTSSQIRQAAETNNADRIGIEVARRQVLLTVSQAWNALNGARASLAVDEAQVKAANLAYEGSRQESRVGLRSTLDVLIAEQNLTSAQLSLVTARHDEYVAAASLLGATGTLFPRDFAPETAVYDPKVNLERIRRAWPWTPWTPAVAGLDKLSAPAVRVMPEPGPSGP
jgi:outer membrane protein